NFHFVEDRGLVGLGNIDLLGCGLDQAEKLIPLRRQKRIIIIGVQRNAFPGGTPHYLKCHVLSVVAAHRMRASDDFWSGSISAETDYEKCHGKEPFHA